MLLAEKLSIKRKVAQFFSWLLDHLVMDINLELYNKFNVFSQKVIR